MGKLAPFFKGEVMFNLKGFFMSEEDEKVEMGNIKVKEDCKIALYGHRVVELKKGNNELPEEDVKEAKSIIKANDL